MRTMARGPAGSCPMARVPPGTHRPQNAIRQLRTSSVRAQPGIAQRRLRARLPPGVFAHLGGHIPGFAHGAPDLQPAATRHHVEDAARRAEVDATVCGLVRFFALSRERTIRTASTCRSRRGGASGSRPAQQCIAEGVRTGARQHVASTRATARAKRRALVSGAGPEPRGPGPARHHGVGGGLFGPGLLRRLLRRFGLDFDDRVGGVDDGPGSDVERRFRASRQASRSERRYNTLLPSFR